MAARVGHPGIEAGEAGDVMYKELDKQEMMELLEAVLKSEGILIDSDLITGTTQLERIIGHFAVALARRIMRA